MQDCFNFHGYDAVGGVVLGFRLLQAVAQTLNQGQTLRLWPSASVFDDEFRQQVSSWQDHPHNQAREAFLAYKDRKVQQILGLADDELFTVEWLERK